MNNLVRAAAAVIGLAATLFAPPASAATWEDVTMQTAIAGLDTAPVRDGKLSVVHFPVTRQPAGTPAYVVNFLAAGINAAGVPCFNCVNGGGTPNFGLPAPDNYVYSNTYYQYNLTWTNISATGTCKVSVSIAAGKKALGHASSPAVNLNGPGTYDWALVILSPAYTGTAIATGKLTCGTSSSILKTTLVFQ